MNYYHMQLHPDDKKNYPVKITMELLSKGFIGIDIDPDKAIKIGCNNKSFNLWTEDELLKFEKENKYGKSRNKWKSQIETFRNLRTDDIVVVRSGKDFVALTKIAGEYIFNQDTNDGIWFRHRYPIKVLAKYSDFEESFRIPKPYTTIEPSKSGKTFVVIARIYQIYKEMNSLKKEIDLLESNKNLVLTGAPGTGKTYLAKKIAEKMTGNNPDETNEQYAFVQFHPSYDYTDFVEGLRPKKEKDSKELGFELRNGIFKEFCKKAKSKPEQNFVFIIDEINRAEISKVFGELFFAIDPSYRGEKGKVKTQYANMQTKETYFTNLKDDFFYVPENVYIIATMNDIDRSVESFDFAMRRRFAWKEIKASERVGMIDEEFKKDEKLNDKKIIQEAKDKLKNLNKAIYNEESKEGIEGLNSSYHIGPAYYLKIKNYDGDFKKLWEYHLEGLLREYLRGLPDAVNKIEELNDAYNSSIKE